PARRQIAISKAAPRREARPVGVDRSNSEALPERFPVNRGHISLDYSACVCLTGVSRLVRERPLKMPFFWERGSMSVMSSVHATSSSTDIPERGALLQWMIFTGLCIFAVVLLWHYGFVRLMVTSDRTYISSLIAVLYIVTCCHCFWRTRAIGREAEA